MSTANEIINPPHLRAAVGFAHAVKCHGTMLFLGGATGADAEGVIHGKGDIVKQFEDSVANISEVMKASGGTMDDVVKLTYFVTDRDAYMANLKQIGQIYRRSFGKHYPAQSLFGVTALYEPDALIEIEAIACVPDQSPSPSVTGQE
ncbi:MAG: RidA family protein [Chloroflexota bacterium]